MSARRLTTSARADRDMPRSAYRSGVTLSRPLDTTSGRCSRLVACDGIADEGEATVATAARNVRERRSPIAIGHSSL